MVVTTGWPQVAATALVLIATCGITFAMFGRFVDNAAADIALRLGLAAISFVTMFHPDNGVSALVAVVVVLATIAGVWRHRAIAPPKTFVLPEDAAESGADAGELAAMAAEARRDYG
jgi:hypothetical protein